MDCTYVLEKVEYFWGSHDCQGSEHQIGSKSYPFERQVVFYRSDLECYEEACGVPDGILRLCAVFNVYTFNIFRLKSFTLSNIDFRLIRFLADLYHCQ